MISLYLRFKTTKHHAVRMTRKNSKLEECSEIRKLCVFGRPIDPTLKKQEGFFQKGEHRELAIKKFE